MRVLHCKRGKFYYSLAYPAKNLDLYFSLFLPGPQDPVQRVSVIGGQSEVRGRAEYRQATPGQSGGAISRYKVGQKIHSEQRGRKRSIRQRKYCSGMNCHKNSPWFPITLSNPCWILRNKSMPPKTSKSLFSGPGSVFDSRFQRPSGEWDLSRTVLGFGQSLSLSANRKVLRRGPRRHSALIWCWLPRGQKVYYYTNFFFTNNRPCILLKSSYYEMLNAKKYPVV